MKFFKIFMNVVVLITAFILGGTVMPYKKLDAPVEERTKPPTFSNEYLDFNVINKPNTTSYVRLSGLPTSDISDIHYTSEPKIYEPLEEDEQNHGHYELSVAGQEDEVFFRSIAMDPPAYQMIVVRENQIIFELEPMSNLSIETSPSGNGFYLYGSLPAEIGSGYRVIRFITDGESFKPVWQQKVEYLTIDQ